MGRLIFGKRAITSFTAYKSLHVKSLYPYRSKR